MGMARGRVPPDENPRQVHQLGNQAPDGFSYWGLGPSAMAVEAAGLGSTPPGNLSTPQAPAPQPGGPVGNDGPGTPRQARSESKGGQSKGKGKGEGVGKGEYGGRGYRRSSRSREPTPPYDIN